MSTQFRDRREAGRRLAHELLEYVDRPDLLVLALPRGGVPVAAEVARRLHAPLDVLVVRKLGLPGQKELAMGAIASGGVRVLNREVVEVAGVPDQVIDAVAAQEQAELERRERIYRGDQPLPEVHAKTVLLVDDGIATGSTMFAAIAALQKLGAGRIIVATPTIARETFHEMREVADDVVAVMVPDDFHGVGQWYENFSQTSDDEVREILVRFAGPDRDISG
ncbi:phosphoribosyl transferase [Verrucomicrobia bacterium SCGC AG-212-E04]|nr:phosphoribosyl transferase [Verrucomicrobia bacterium SCGC AG-212-E04]